MIGREDRRQIAPFQRFWTHFLCDASSRCRTARPAASSTCWRKSGSQPCRVCWFDLQVKDELVEDT